MSNNFNGIVEKAADSNYSIIGFNIFGYEDAIAVVRAAEEINAPILLMTNKLAVEHMPVEYWGKLLGSIAEDAKVPVSVHLDHAKEYELAVRAIMSGGFSSVMYDGSKLPLEENIAKTKEIVKLAHSCGVLVEGEIGSVAYSDIDNNVKNVYTDPKEAKLFAEKTGVDWLAVSIGTVHRLQNQKAVIQYDRLKSIQKEVNVPLVIHGSSGIKDKDLSKLSTMKIGKFNVGTALRLAFGNELKNSVNENPEEFDRLKLFKQPMIKTQEAAKNKMKIVGFNKNN